MTAIPFVSTGAYPVRPGNRLRPLIDGEPAFRRICQAVEAARHSVWVCLAFVWPEFEMPDGRGSFFDVLERAAQRGLDVRLIPWRPDAGPADWLRNAFWGSAEHRAALVERRSRLRIRWDRAQPGFCQHQKIWLMDAGRDGETAFVGGINQNPHSMVAPGHRGEGQNHDVYLEIRGPAVVDVHHNFAQRWNEASERTPAAGRGARMPISPSPNAFLPSKATARSRFKGPSTKGDTPTAGPLPAARSMTSGPESAPFSISTARRSGPRGARSISKISTWTSPTLSCGCERRSRAAWTRSS
jgi:cardiolipin synthase A/B